MDWTIDERWFDSRQGKDFFFNLRDGFWGPPSLLFNGCCGWDSRALKLTAHLHLTPKLRMSDLYIKSRTCLYGVHSDDSAFTFTFTVNVISGSYFLFVSIHYRHSPTYVVVTFRKIWRKSELSIRVVSYMYTCGQLYVYVWSAICIRVVSYMYTCGQLYVYAWSAICIFAWESRWNPNSKTLEPDQRQHDRPVACVIAQQYCSATFVSLCSHSRKEKFGGFQKRYFIFYFVDIA
jgi:hypothetical protein